MAGGELAGAGGTGVGIEAGEGDVVGLSTALEGVGGAGGTSEAGVLVSPGAGASGAAAEGGRLDATPGEVVAQPEKNTMAAPQTRAINPGRLVRKSFGAGSIIKYVSAPNQS